MAILTPEQDKDFQALVRTLDGRRRRDIVHPVPGTKNRIVAAVEDGFASLEPDPVLFPKRRKEEEEEDDSNEMYLRDYSRAGAGLAQDYSLSFLAPLTDKGDGEVDIRNVVTGETGTFTRATVATCRLKNGLLKKVASGVPRSHYLADGSYGGYLAEGARTNLCLRSEEFDNAGWAGSIATANTDAAPDGTTTADTLTDDSAAATESARQDFTVADDALDHSFSLFVEKTSGVSTFAAIDLAYTGGTAVTRRAVLNTNTGAAASLETSTTCVIEDWGSFWRFCVTGPNNNLGNTALQVRVYPAYNSSGTQSADVAAQGAIVAWGAQLEKAAFASSYIPTTTASVTRDADVLTFPINLIGTKEGTLYFEGAPLATAGANIGLYVGGTPGADQMDLRNHDAGAVFLGNSASASQFSMTVGTWARNTIGKLAGTYKPDRFTACFDGGAVSTDTSGALPVSFTKFHVGHHNSTNQFYGAIKNAHAWQRAMPDAMLQSLTA